MILSDKATAAPSTEPVTLAEAKAYLRVDFSDDDSLITEIIKSARRRAEDVTNRSFFTQTRRAVLSEFPASDFYLPSGRVTEITSIQYFDTDNQEQTLTEGTDYLEELDGDTALIRFLERPSLSENKIGPIRISYSAGHATVAEISPNIITAIKMLIAHYYDNRNPVVAGSEARHEVPETVKAILNRNHSIAGF